MVTERVLVLHETLEQKRAEKEFYGRLLRYFHGDLELHCTFQAEATSTHWNIGLMPLGKWASSSSSSCRFAAFGLDLIWTLPFIQPFRDLHWNPRPLSLEESLTIHSIIYPHPKMSYSSGYRTLNGDFMIAWAASLLKMIKPYCLIWELAKSFQAKKK